MRRRRIGEHKVSAVGLGVMALSVTGRPDRTRAVATIRAALDAGITLFDTADSWATDATETGHGEELLVEALRGRPERVLVATKGGLRFRAEGPWERAGAPDQLAAAARASLRRLGGDSLGLYQLHRPDPLVPFEDSVGALGDLLDEGIAGMVGVCNVTVDQIAQANDLLGGRLSAVQNRFSPIARSGAREMDYCAEHEIAFLPWSPLGGATRVHELGRRAPAFAEVAAELGVSTQRVALAWELALQHSVIPLVGARRPGSIRDSAPAADVVLTAPQLERLSARR